MLDLPTVQGFFDAAPFMGDLGVRPVSVEPGRVGSELQIEPRHLQHTGQVHAGVMASMVDHTMGTAAQTLAPEGHWAITAELKTSLLRPGKGVKLVCEAVVIKPGRTLSFTEGEVFGVDAQGQRTLVLKASATMALVAKKD